MSPPKQPSRATKGNSSRSDPATKKDLADLRSDFSNRFERIDQRFEGIDQRFEGIDRRFEGIERRFEKIDHEFTLVRKEIREGVEEAKRHMGVLQEETHHKLDLIVEAVSPLLNRMQDHEDRISKVEDEIPVLKAAVALRK